MIFSDMRFKNRYERNGFFRNCSILKEIIIPEGVVAIEEREFENCVNLEKITFPKSLEIIGRNAFRGCKNIKEVNTEDLENYRYVYYEDSDDQETKAGNKKLA